jgi:YHS domain-containing protein
MVFVTIRNFRDAQLAARKALQGDLIMRHVSLAFLAIALIGTGVAFAAKTISLEGIKCPLSDGPVKEDKSAAHLDGKVYFCCEKCSAKFEADKDKYAAKANQQLVATKQYEQKACPMTGGALNKETKIKVGEAEVAFCCTKCKGAAEGKKGDEQIELVFGKKAFEKGKFAKVEAKK